jgi:hypothetical protein
MGNLKRAPRESSPINKKGKKKKKRHRCFREGYMKERGKADREKNHKNFVPGTIGGNDGWGKT